MNISPKRSYGTHLTSKNICLILGSDGDHVGTVDHMDDTGTRIKLTKTDPTANGEHHFIPLSWVTRVDKHVHLNKPPEDARAEWEAGDK